MVSGQRKSRTMRRVYKRVPSGNKVVYELRKPAAARCGNCGTLLNGIARKRSIGMKNSSKSAKRPQRPFAGVLCSKCTKDLMVLEAREE